MKKFLKEFFGKAMSKTGFTPFVRDNFPLKDITVLMYHKVDPQKFEEQVAYIKENHNPISEKDLLDYYYKKKDLPKNSVLLTFDDGYYNNYKYAYPILKKHQVPALVFVITDLIGKQKMPWYDEVDYLIANTKKTSLMFREKKYTLNKKGKKDLKSECYYYMINVDNKKRQEILTYLRTKLSVKLPKTLPEQYRFMTWKQLEEIKDVFAIGSHTTNHPILPNESAQEQERQLKKSKEVLLKKGFKPLSFCYPNGDYDKTTVNLVKKYYKLGFSSNFGRAERSISKYLIQRVSGYLEDSKEILGVKLTQLRRLFNRSKKSSTFKVIHVTNYYFPQTGGLTTNISNLYNFTKKQHIPVRVIPFPTLFRKIEKLCGNNNTVHKLLVFKFALLFFLQVAVEKLFHKKIIIHSHSANFCAGVALFTKPLGTKVIHTFHSDPKMSHDTHKTNVPAKKTTKVISPKKFLNKVDLLTSVSKKLGEESAMAFDVKKNITTIYGVNASFEVPKVSKSKKTKLIFIGQLLDIKDPMLFLESLTKLDEDFEAVILGEGPLRPQVEEYIKKHKLPVKLKGILSHKLAMKEIASSHALVLTSKGEGLGNVLAEAMSLDVPVVGTAVGGIPEIIRPNCGILIRSRKPEDIAAGIKRALIHSKTLVKNAKQLLKTEFDYEKNSQKYISMYSYLAKSRLHKSSEDED